jgi:uncharacterized membrane protein
MARISTSVWFLPVVCVVFGALVSFGTIAIDRAFNYEAIPSELIGGPTAVMTILSTVALSMVSLTALVLTITMVVVQLAMGQFSPRIVQRILRDKPSQLAIGLFVATFVHAILAIREVTDNGDGTGHVPGVAVVTALVLVVVSIAVLVYYVHHIGLALRVSALIELVGNETRKLIDRTYPDAQAVVDSPDIVRATDSGVIASIDQEKLVDLAQRSDAVLELVPALGEFVPADAALFRIAGNTSRLDGAAVRACLTLDEERSLDEDVAYGLRLLVDIAERSLSESPLQDPTTAVQAIDRLHDILRQLARRTLSDGRYRDAAGVVRLIVPTMTWDAYVQLGVDEIRIAGAGSPQVTRRLMAMLRDLKSVATPDRMAIIDREIGLLMETAKAQFVDDRDLIMAMDADGQGIGEAIDRGGSPASGNS